MYIQNCNQNSKLVIEKGRKPFAFLIEHEDNSFYVKIFFTEKSDLRQLLNAILILLQMLRKMQMI